MAGENEIDITAVLHDELSAPANRAERNLRDLGRQADETAVELQAMGASADSAGHELDSLSRSAEESNRTQVRSTSATNQNTEALGKNASASRRATTSNKRLASSNRETESTFKRLFGWFKKFGVMGKLLTGFRWTAIANGVAFLGKAIYGLGAAAYAGIAGLTPLLGMMVAIPAAIGTAVQAMGTLKLATKGMGGLIGVLSNPASTATEIAAASKGMARSQVLFAKAVASTNKQWKGLQKRVGSAFFQGLDVQFKRLVGDYMPILNRQLVSTAKSWNYILKKASDYADKSRTQKDVNAIMKAQSYELRNGGVAMLHFTRAALIMYRTANPTMMRMTMDLRRWSNGLADAAENNRGRMSVFFKQSYSLMKDTLRVSGNFIMGLYNIGKMSSTLSGMMGHNIDDISKKFRQWSDSPGGRKQVRGFFDDMIPVVQELGRWIPTLSSAINQMVMSNSDFIEMSKAFRGVAIPAIVAGFNFLTDHTVPIVNHLVDTYKKLKDSGIAGGTGRALSLGDKAITAFAGAMDKLPDPMKKLIGVASTALAAYGILSKIGAIGKIKSVANFATKGKLFGDLGVQKVFVVNWPPGMMAGGVGGAAAAGEGAVAGEAAAAGGAGAAAGRASTLARVGSALPIVAIGATASIVGWKQVLDLIHRGPSTTWTKTNGFFDSMKQLAGGAGEGAVAGGTLGGVPGAVVGSALSPFKGAWDILHGNKPGSSKSSASGSSDMNGHQIAAAISRGFKVVGVGSQRNINRANRLADSPRNATPSGYLLRQPKGHHTRIDQKDPTVTAYEQQQARQERIRTAAVRQQQRQDRRNTKANGMLPQQISTKGKIDADAATLSRMREGLGAVAMARPTVRADAKQQAYLQKMDNAPKAHTDPSAGVISGSQKSMAGMATRSSGGSALAGITKNTSAIKAQDTATHQLGSSLSKLPKSVQTKVSQPGIDHSTQMINNLVMQYSLTPKQKNTLIKLLGADDALNKAHNIASTINGLHDKSVTLTTTVRKVVKGGFGPQDASLSYAGNPTRPGETHLVGEFGKEAWISRTGAVKMLGVSGPEIRRFSEHGAVIPAGATADPHGGDYGNAPGWAQDAFKRAAGGVITPHGLRGSNDGTATPLPPVNVSVYPQNPMDVETAIRNAIRKSQMDAEERS